MICEIPFALYGHRLGTLISTAAGTSRLATVIVDSLLLSLDDQ
jgi:hypothetical protein